MDKTVEEIVGIGRIADRVMPGGSRQLPGDEGGRSAVTILQDQARIVVGLGIEGPQALVIEDE